MRAIAISEYGGPDRLELTDMPEPIVGPDSVLIRVKAAGVNPVDAGIRRGGLAERIPCFLPLIPGWDAAGVVEQVGPAVEEFAPGDEVLGYLRKDFVRDGTYAELAVARSFHFARRPRSLSWEEAGALPLAGLTALQLVRDALALQRGERILIHGASGGVGGFAVQIAKAGGAHVIAVASAASHDHVRDLGADELIDYTEQDVVEVVRERHPDGIEVVADLVGGDAQTRSADVLQEGRGRLGSIITPPDRDLFAARGQAAHYVFVRPDRAGLETLGAMADAGELRVPIAAALPLEEAGAAHEQIETRHTRGKIVLTI
jgi:NADPH:quinone reductase-like Zn-dependent oxidoreductase